MTKAFKGVTASQSIFSIDTPSAFCRLPVANTSDATSLLPSMLKQNFRCLKRWGFACSSLSCCCIPRCSSLVSPGPGLRVGTCWDAEGDMMIESCPRPQELSSSSLTLSWLRAVATDSTSTWRWCCWVLSSFVLVALEWQHLFQLADSPVAVGGGLLQHWDGSMPGYILLLVLSLLLQQLSPCCCCCRCCGSC